MNHSIDTFITINHKKLHYQVIGQGKPIILIHGFPSPARPDHLLVRTLSKQYQIYLIDLPGFGKSEKLDSFHLDQYVQTIHSFISILKLEKPAIIGFSMGGIISLKYATLYSDNIDKLIICASCASFKHTDTMLKLLLSLFVSTKKIPFAQKRVKKLHQNPDRILKWWQQLEPKTSVKNPEVKQTLEDITKLDLDFIYDFATWINDMDFHPECQKITVPTLFLAGSKDRLMTSKAIKKTHSMVPQSTFIENPGKEHFNILDDSMMPHITKFLKS